MGKFKDILFFLLAFILLCVYVGTIVAAIVIVWPVAWYMAVAEFVVIALAFPAWWRCECALLPFLPRIR